MVKKTITIPNRIHYQWSGKFKAPSSEWMHMTRSLNDYELIIVTDGVLYIADEEREYTLKEGEYLIMSPTKKQYGYEPSDCSFYWMHFIPYEEGITHEHELSIPMQKPIPHIDRLIILLQQLKDSERRYHHRYTLDIMALNILLELYNQIQILKKGSFTSNKVNLYYAILEYINWNKLDRITVTEVAQYFGYHEKYLSQLFKGMAGIPLKQYLLNEKMEHAKAELMDSNKTVSQIAYSLGYKDSHNFSNSFKKQVGMYPREYRVSYMKAPENKK